MSKIPHFRIFRTFEYWHTPMAWLAHTHTTQSFMCTKPTRHSILVRDAETHETSEGEAHRSSWAPYEARRGTADQTPQSPGAALSRVRRRQHRVDLSDTDLSGWPQTRTRHTRYAGNGRMHTKTSGNTPFAYAESGDTSAPLQHELARVGPRRSRCVAGASERVI